METDDLIVLAREKAQHYPMPAERYPGCERDHLRCLLECLADEIELRDRVRADLLRLIENDGRTLREYAAARDRAEHECAELRAENRRLLEALKREERADLTADKRRLDWLADPENDIGQVLLPTRCVEQNPESMRAAIDAAMGEDVN